MTVSDQLCMVGQPQQRLSEVGVMCPYLGARKVLCVPSRDQLGGFLEFIICGPRRLSLNCRSKEHQATQCKLKHGASYSTNGWFEMT